MPTPDEATSLAAATRVVLAGHGPHLGDWPEGVRVESVDAGIEGNALVVRIRFSDRRHPTERLGTAFVVGETFWVANDGVLDADWTASHAYAHFCEATWAGGDPLGWPRAADGIRWYRDNLL